MAEKSDSLADAKAKMKLRIERMAATPLVEVLGVVGPSGPGGSQSRGDVQWTFLVTLVAWKLSGGEMRLRPLNVRKFVPREDLDGLKKQFRPYSVVRFQAHLEDDPADRTAFALLETSLGVDSSDAELNHHSAELQKPLTYDDPVLGTFTFDRRVNWLSTETIWNGKPVTLTISTNAEFTEVPQAMQAARTLWEQQDEWSRRILDFAADDLLEVQNDAWRDDDQEEDTTSEEFKSRMTVETISVDSDGSFEFWYDDGDLFAGHTILIRGSLAEGPMGSDIAG